MYYNDFGGEHKDTKFYRKWMIISFIFVIVSLPFVIFIPSKDTLIYMKVAELCTKDNIKITTDAIKETADYVINAIKTIKG